MRGLNGAQLLILDDWGLEPLDAGARRDLYEILEERYDRRSTILISQVPVDKWHQVIGDPTYADAILDRLVHNAHRIDAFEGLGLAEGDAIEEPQRTHDLVDMRP
jgi:DNA replication protein DnaC